MRPASAAGRLADAGLVAVAPSRPLNVLMVVMESVGAHRLGLYGAPFDDTPNLVELACHALVFDRVYVAEAQTSAALGALLASVYPDHDWPSLTQLAPALSIPGLPAVCRARVTAQRSYIRASSRSNRQGEFVRKPRFDQVIDKRRDSECLR